MIREIFLKGSVHIGRIYRITGTAASTRKRIAVCGVYE
jgi:hypothetical protein